MISHVTIAVSDFERALAFYGDVLEVLGLTRSYYDADIEAASFRDPKQPRPLLHLRRPFDGKDAVPGNGPMVAFLCPDRDTVQKAYDRALKKGAEIEGKPGLRDQYHDDYFGAYVRDTEGNKICFVCHDPD